MAHNDLVEAILESQNSDCALPKSLWILPGDSIPTAKKPGCRSTANHSFSIALAVKCIRNPFVLVKRESEIHLEGQFMELVAMRKLVKDSVHKFASAIQFNSSYGDISWAGDRLLYPSSEEQALLATAINYEVTIFNQ